MTAITPLTDPLATVLRLQRATNDHDLDALAACFAESYVNETPAHPSRSFVGREQVRSNWTRILAAVPDLTSTMVASVVSGDTVWAEWAWTGQPARRARARHARDHGHDRPRRDDLGRPVLHGTGAPGRGRHRRRHPRSDDRGAGMIAIAGGTGTLGRRLVPRLLDRGDHVRVLARHPDRIPDAWRGRVEGVAVDVRQAASIEPALTGVRTLVCAITGFGGPDAGGVTRVDGDGNLALIRAAEAAGVEHVILMSVAQSAPDHPIELFRAKYAAEQRLRAVPARVDDRATDGLHGDLGRAPGPPSAEWRARARGRAGQQPDQLRVGCRCGLRRGRRAIAIHCSAARPWWCPALRTSRWTTWSRPSRASPTSSPAIDHAPRALIRLIAAGMSLRRPVLAGQLRTALVMDTRDMAMDAASLRRQFPDLAPTGIDDVIRQQLAPTEPRPILEAA